MGKLKPELWSPSTDALHQTMHIHFPELYRAASSGSSVWFSLWRGDGRAKGTGAVSRKLALIERDTGLEINVSHGATLWDGIRKVQDLKIGIAKGEKDHPFHFLPMADRQIGDYDRATISYLGPVVSVFGGFF